MEPVRILLVEDNVPFAKGLRDLFLSESQGLPVIVDIAGDAEQAAAAVEANPPGLVLMDIRLPGESGIAATRKIRELSATTLIVMFTVSEDEDDVLAALEAGASGYLLKTMDLSDLISTVLAILQGHLVIPHQLAGPILGSLRGEDPGTQAAGTTATNTRVTKQPADRASGC